jgi:hypothetical protein
MTGVYCCPRCRRRFSQAEAAMWRYECKEKGCRKPRGSFHRLGPQSSDDHEELWFLTRTEQGIRWNPPNSLSPATRGAR